ASGLAAAEPVCPRAKRRTIVRASEPALIAKHQLVIHRRRIEVCRLRLSIREDGAGGGRDWKACDCSSAARDEGAHCRDGEYRSPTASDALGHTPARHGALSQSKTATKSRNHEIDPVFFRVFVFSWQIV